MTSSTPTATIVALAVFRPPVGRPQNALADDQKWSKLRLLADHQSDQYGRLRY